MSFCYSSFKASISITSVVNSFGCQSFPFESKRCIYLATKNRKSKKNKKKNMWSNEESGKLITSIEYQVLKTFPITSTNNNHDFTGNLLDIADNWSEIADKLKRSGESENKNDFAVDTKIVIVGFWSFFSANFLKYFILVTECKDQWRKLIRQFLFITERINTDESDFHRNYIVYPIQWLLMEQMMFLTPYTQKYKRYEKPVEVPKEELDDETNVITGTVQNSADKIITFRELKRMTIDMLKSRATPSYIRVLLENVEKHYNHQKSVICKIIYMIELNTVDWRDSDKKKFLQWYYDKLRKIASKR